VLALPRENTIELWARFHYLQPSEIGASLRHGKIVRASECSVSGELSAAQSRDGFPLQPSVISMMKSGELTPSTQPQASEPLLVDHRPRALAVSIASLMKAARPRRRFRECVRAECVREEYDRAECVREEYVHEEYDHDVLRTA
jgi:hypothetical protein